MDPRNYFITNLEKPRRRINPKSKTDDLNENDVDFDVELKNTADGMPKYINVRECMKDQTPLESETILKINYLSDKNEKVGLDDLVCEKFAGKKKFRFVFSLNDFHKYRYEVKLTKKNELTFRRMFKIICQSAEHVLDDTREFVAGADERAAAKEKRAELRRQMKEHMENSEDDDEDVKDQTGGWLNYIKSFFGGADEKLFNVDEKLQKLQVEYIGVQEEACKIFVEFTGFEEDIDPAASL
jgi:hypothetical protein